MILPAALLLSVLAHGVTEDSILIGMEGPAASFSADEENLGMRLAIKQANSQGGIHGRQLVIAAYARGTSDPVRQSVANVRRLVEEDDVFLLFNFGGPAAVEIGAYAQEQQVPYMFPHTALLTVDGARHVFTSYPRYAGESRAMLEYLATARNVQRVGVIYAPNIYGEYFVGRAASLAADLGYEFVGGKPLARNPEDALREMRALQALGPDAVIMALYPAGAKRVVEAKSVLEWPVLLVSSGPLTDEQYLNIADGAAEGTMGFCYYPDPNEAALPGIDEYREMMAEHFPGHALNRYSLYGYVFGKLVLEGLREAGRALDRNTFIDAMESIRNWDSGGIMPPVSFSATDHHAQEAGFFCELEDGRFRPLSTWVVPGAESSTRP